MHLFGNAVRYNQYNKLCHNMISTNNKDITYMSGKYVINNLI